MSHLWVQFPGDVAVFFHYWQFEMLTVPESFQDWHFVDHRLVDLWGLCCFFHRKLLFWKGIPVSRNFFWFAVEVSCWSVDQLAPILLSGLLIGCGEKWEILRYFQGKLCGKKGLLCGKLCDFLKADLKLFFRSQRRKPISLLSNGQLGIKKQ